MKWRADATCRHHDPELFFPVGTGALADQQAAEAKAVCHRCPVMARCLTWAMANGPVGGVGGGTTEAERASARRRNVEVITAGRAGR
jgi:WhiB family transcriptional regulator, redox-sensing transcriptional regulator